MSYDFVRIYDFDGTIYNGNSTLDFFRFEFRRNILNFLSLPFILFFFIRYKAERMPLEEFIEKSFAFILVRTNLENEAELFWDKNFNKIKKFYMKNKNQNDIIISGSPEFLLKPICRRLDVKLVASRFDVSSRCFVDNICMDVEKLVRLSEIGLRTCDEFYTDSIESDAPMIHFSKKAFLVKGERVEMIWSKQ